MRRLFIHLGTGKAGSTAIQHALLNQEEALREIDILNPITGRRRGAHWGLHEEVRDDTEPLFFPQLSIESRDAPVTVISCEALCLLSDDGIRRLVKATAEWDVRAILYLRRPAGFMSSSYRQHIKTGKFWGTEKEFVTTVGGRLAYDELIIRLRTYFPLTVRVYDLLRTRIEEDFFQLIGAGHLKPERIIANGTPCDGATRLMLASNKCFSKRSRRRRINKKLVAMEHYFSWMPSIDNSVFDEAGSRFVTRWNRDVLLQYISENELDALATP